MSKIHLRTRVRCSPIFFLVYLAEDLKKISLKDSFNKGNQQKFAEAKFEEKGSYARRLLLVLPEIRNSVHINDLAFYSDAALGFSTFQAFREDTSKLSNTFHSNVPSF